MEAQLIGAALVLGFAQLAAVLAFRRRLARPSVPPAPSLPPLSVLTACKGPQDGLEENVRTVLAQDYPAAVEFVFVVPSRDDPAFGELTRILAALGDARAKLLVSDADPREASEQNLNLLFGLERLAPESSVVVFADADIRVGPRWLAALAGPLEDPKVGCVTAPALYVPAAGLPAALRCSWIVHGLPYMASLGYASGQSLAVRRADFKAWGAAALYARSINMDLTLSGLARKRGFAVELAAGELPLWLEPCSTAQLLRGFNKWMLHFKLYAPLVWLLGALSTAAKAAVYLNAGVSPLAAAVVAGSDVLCAVLSGRALEGALGARLAEAGCSPGRLTLRAAAAAPFMFAFHAVNLAVSFWMSRLDWGGRRYRIRGPYAVSVGASEATASPAVTAVCVILGGLAYGGSFWPGGPWWLHWAAHVPLLWALRGRDPWPGFLIGWGYGTVAWLMGAPGLAGSLERFIGLPSGTGWAPLLLLDAWHGLMWAGVAAAVVLLAPPLGRAWGGREDAAAAAVFVPAAVLLDAVFPRFIPVLLADSQVACLSAVQLAAYLGPWAVSAWVAALNALLFLAAAGHRRKAALAAAACLAAANLGFGALALRGAEPSPALLRVALIQTNFPHGLSFPRVDFHPQNLALLNSLSDSAAAQGPLDLVVWPESAYERFMGYRELEGRPQEVSLGGLPFAEASRADMPAGATLLANTVAEALVPRGSRWRKAVYNVAFLKAADGTFAGLVRKRQLIPFGEFMPMPRRLGFLRRFSPRTYVFSPGPGGELLSLPGGARLGALICYEDLFPSLAWAYRRAGADVLVNLTNDVWFTDGFTREQHLAYSALRAVETGLPMVRAVNTGISAVVDPYGRVVSRLEPDAVGILLAEVPALKLRRALAPPWAVPVLAAAALLLLGLRARAGDRAPRT
ncbi:MAG: apolipoprotein N-acyltransferase [Elusimicrobia bacterium]|nr:apolipoprotein N-acyltransferase [Elusimicrobiota bacterium]